MAGNLTTQVREIAAVTTAVARGDLTKQITVDVRGEILDLKMTVNEMTRSLSVFAAEVTRFVPPRLELMFYAYLELELQRRS